MIYVWMVFGMLVLKDAFKENLCVNMFQCVTSYVDITLRGSGVRDIMTTIGNTFSQVLYPYSDFFIQ
jgi:hypothetical protein